DVGQQGTAGFIPLDDDHGVVGQVGQDVPQARDGDRTEGEDRVGPRILIPNVGVLVLVHGWPLPVVTSPRYITDARQPPVEPRTSIQLIAVATIGDVVGVRPGSSLVATLADAYRRAVRHKQAVVSSAGVLRQGARRVPELPQFP